MSVSKATAARRPPPQGGARNLGAARRFFGHRLDIRLLIGVLVAPVMTMYYDSGFLIGLKAFVAAIIGGFVSYPITALGALAVGGVESFASFWSGALKDVIVFSLLIPVLMLRSFLSRHAEEEVEEIDQ